MHSILLALAALLGTVVPSGGLDADRLAAPPADTGDTADTGLPADTADTADTAEADADADTDADTDTDTDTADACDSGDTACDTEEEAEDVPTQSAAQWAGEEGGFGCATIAPPAGAALWFLGMLVGAVRRRS